VTDEEVKLQGTTNVETLLNNLPQISPSQNNTISNGSSGTATVDLRNLGVNRTLVLIDGKRLGPGDASGGTGSAADLNFIPAPLVSSIEVLTGGASTDYGSDALAGVVNFKMKRDFEGIEIDQQVGGFQHDQQNSFAQGLLAKDNVATPGDAFDGMVEDGEAIPTPTAPEALRPIEGSIEVARMLIRAELPGRSVRLNISMDEGLVAAVDLAAKSRATTRSGLLADAVRRYLTL
jgi:iron complex outermembrane receptor protein